MAKFFVGQRVRIKWSNTYPWLSGQEGTITEVEDEDCEVHPDCWQTAQSPNGDGWFWPYYSQIEPIVPEGSTPSEFSFHELMDNLKEEQHEHY